jgi:hypothetical protein
MFSQNESDYNQALTPLLCNSKSACFILVANYRSKLQSVPISETCVTGCNQEYCKDVGDACRLHDVIVGDGIRCDVDRDSGGRECCMKLKGKGCDLLVCMDPSQPLGIKGF